jgi:hypothetical protein
MKPIVFISSSYGDDEEFEGVAEPNSSIYSPETVYPRSASQRISYVNIIDVWTARMWSVSIIFLGKSSREQVIYNQWHYQQIKSIHNYKKQYVDNR